MKFNVCWKEVDGGVLPMSSPVLQGMLFPVSVVWVLLSPINGLYGLLTLGQISDISTFCTWDLFPVRPGDSTGSVSFKRMGRGGSGM